MTQRNPMEPGPCCEAHAAEYDRDAAEAAWAARQPDFVPPGLTAVPYELTPAAEEFLAGAEARLREERPIEDYLWSADVAEPAGHVADAPQDREAGPVHVFNPQRIGGEPSTFRWNPPAGEIEADGDGWRVRRADSEPVTVSTMGEALAVLAAPAGDREAGN